MLKLMRYHTLAGLIAILGTVVLLFWFYRHVAIDGIVQLAERTNVTLARTALNAMRPDLLPFLRRTAAMPAQEIARQPLPPALADAIRQLMHDRAVARIKLYNARGLVVYSNKYQQIGSNQRGNRGFATAMDGRVVNKLVYRDTFNSFDGHTEEDNLMQTYLPVQASPADPIEGVFEVYTDVNHLANQAERTEFTILLGTLFILSATYVAVVLVAWRAGNIIELQQRTILERTQTLEVLSAQMLKSEESHKKKIAHELHEGIAQTLSAIKFHLENLQLQGAADDPRREAVDAIIPALRGAIHDVRTIATELRPSSIDDVGLLLTTYRLCRDVEAAHPPLAVSLQTTLLEQDIPGRLKIILYRILVSVLDDMARQSESRRIHIALWLDNRVLTLLIDNTASDELDKTAVPLAKIDPQLSAGFALMEELTTLSGGQFSAAHHAGGGTTLRAGWPV